MLKFDFPTIFEIWQELFFLFVAVVVPLVFIALAIAAISYIIIKLLKI